MTAVELRTAIRRAWRRELIASIVTVASVPALFVLLVAGAPLPVSLGVLGLGQLGAYILRRDRGARTGR